MDAEVSIKTKIDKYLDQQSETDINGKNSEIGGIKEIGIERKKKNARSQRQRTDYRINKR